MNWQPTLSWEDAKAKATILNNIRSFFIDRNVVEVETPLMGNSTVTDVHLEAFITNYNYAFNKEEPSSEMYLQTSPEYCMKRLISSGYQSIYQISKAFRHESKGRFHNPEFTILEWYRLDFDQLDLIAEVSELLKIILNCKNPKILSYQELFISKVSIDPLDTTIQELLSFITTRGKMSDWLKNVNELDILLQFVLSEIIEPTIGIEEPLFIKNFPVSQASLAKINDDDPRVSDRFECYFKGIELVNGFCELTDVDQQLLRFKKDNVERLSMNLLEKPIDKMFIKALEFGLPKCSGVALGVDRLLMLALNKKSIQEVISFPVDRA